MESMAVFPTVYIESMRTWGSGPLLCMAGYSSLCELFFIMSKFDFDRVDPLEPNFLVLDNIDLSHFIKSFPENINFANTIFNCLMPEECTLFQIGKLDSHHSIMGSMMETFLRLVNGGK